MKQDLTLLPLHELPSKFVTSWLLSDRSSSSLNHDWTLTQKCRCLLCLSPCLSWSLFTVRGYNLAVIDDNSSQGDRVTMENAALSWLAQFASHSSAEKGTCTVLEAGSDAVHTLTAPWPGCWHALNALDLQHKSANFSISVVEGGDTGLLQPFLPRPVPYPHPQCRVSSFEKSQAASCPGGPNSLWPAGSQNGPQSLISPKSQHWTCVPFALADSSALPKKGLNRVFSKRCREDTRLQPHVPLEAPCVCVCLGRQCNALTAAWRCLERCWRPCKHLPRGGGGRGKCVRQHCSRSLFLCSAPLLLLLLQLGGCNCAAPLPAKFWRWARCGGSAASAAAAPARPPLIYAFFYSPIPRLKCPWKPARGSGRKGPAHVHGMMPALRRRGAGWNSAGNEVLVRHLLHLPERQGSVAASPSTSCSG